MNVGQWTGSLFLPLIAACGGNVPPLRRPEPPPAKSNACCGVVYDTTNLGLLAGAEVEADAVRLREAGDHPPAPDPVVTDDDGRFCISSLPAGEYDLTVSRTGYKEIRLNAVPISERGARVRIELLPALLRNMVW